MWCMIYLISSFIIGFLIGFYHDKLKIIEEIEIKPNPEQIKERLFTPKTQKTVAGGVINYPTQDEIDYVESGEAEVDKVREKLFEENFKI